jgi:pyrroloquinoline quinone (PQQ) biosynthesis protein C
MAIARLGQDPLTPDELMDALEQVRSDYTGGNPAAARRRPPDSPDKVAAEKRRIHKGGDGNHRFEGEPYLNIRDDKAVRRFQLRKLIDEGGQDSVGGPVPSHPTLQRWNSEEFGVSQAEIEHLEMEDALPEALVRNGWWYYMHRTEPWPVLLGSALVSEGAKRLPAVREAQLRDLDETRELYESWGIKNIDRAMKNQLEHSPIGADDDHVVFGENMTREHVNTPELQERLRKVFTLRIQQSKA